MTLHKMKAALESLESGPDHIEMTVPLFLRCLEWARESHPTDVDLHIMTENIVNANKLLDILDYESLLVNTSKGPDDDGNTLEKDPNPNNVEED